MRPAGRHGLKGAWGLRAGTAHGLQLQAVIILDSSVDRSLASISGNYLVSYVTISNALVIVIPDLSGMTVKEYFDTQKMIVS
ncbi:MAG: hypothetical protein Q7T62_05160 [Undibacterium sp.]|nr:hypothetical protein [Undibacterium sp.]